MVILKQKRSDLGEGRTYGIGFSILKKDKKNYETIMPFTACKDYLNDVVNIENTGCSDYNEIYGFEHDFTGVFKNKRFFYLSFCSVNNYGSGVFKIPDTVLSKNIENLISNINKLESFINLFKSRTSFKSLEVIECEESSALDGRNCYVLRVPMFWFKNRFNLGLLTLLIRLSFDKKIDSLEIKKTYLASDLTFTSTFNKFLKLKNFRKMLKYKSNVLNDISNVHNQGFCYAYKTLRDGKKIDEGYVKN